MKDAIVQLPSETSLGTEPAAALLEDDHYLRHQQQVFDDLSPWFADRTNEVPPELEPIYQAMANRLLDQIASSMTTSTTTTTTTTATTCRILDVACGTGVLWEFLVQAAEHRQEHKIQLEIVGVDLSPKMVAFARNRIELLQQEHPQHSFRVHTSDVVSFCSQKPPPQQQLTVDGVIMNACFGNFWDPQRVLRVLPGRVACISHPLGASFVQALHDKDPKMVPHVLPETKEQVMKLVQGTPWTLGSLAHGDTYYLTTLVKR